MNKVNKIIIPIISPINPDMDRLHFMQADIKHIFTLTNSIIIHCDKPFKLLQLLHTGDIIEHILQVGDTCPINKNIINSINIISLKYNSNCIIMNVY